MVDFSLNEKDQAVFVEMQKLGQAKRKHARYYDEHEDEMLPEEFPEAVEFDHIDQIAMDRGEDGCTPSVFYLLKTMEDYRGDFLSLRALKMALGNASLS